jgi:vancomycin resistance protein YoaR
MPNGYASDGTAYDPNSGAKPVRISDDRKPNPLRYQYYLTDKYVKNYIPKNAGISHFQYITEQNGRSVDAEALAASVINAVNNKDYSVITVPTTVLEPALKKEDVMRFTQLVSSWTSSYESHNNEDRNFNVAKLSALINGVVINPGETWSINKQAGPRTYENGWKGAAGIYDGAYVTEPGGGVCQVSSTVYNAALRAGLDIVESSRHSIISNYMPIGLDATISTGNKDLKLHNPYDTPVFLVSYVNTKDKNVTVEIYGPPVVNEKYGEVILDFTSEVTAETELPETIVHYKAAQTPDGKPIDPGDSKLYIHPRKGTTAQVYIHYLSPDGTELGSKKLYTAKYPKIIGEKYVNDIPQPGTTDAPSETPSMPEDTPPESDE